MFFIGGMAGSTTGGIKLIRTILVVKYIRTEITRMLHPKGLHHVKIGNDVIDDEIVRSTLGFYLFYILIFVACALTISMNGLDMISSLAISASSIGNIGPGAGEGSRLAIGSTIFGGMLISTFFTLYVTPVMYVFLTKNTKRIDAVDLQLSKELKR